MYVFLFPYVKMTNIKYVKILLFNTFCITRESKRFGMAST